MKAVHGRLMLSYGRVPDGNRMEGHSYRRRRSLMDGSFGREIRSEGDWSAFFILGAIYMSGKEHRVTLVLERKRKLCDGSGSALIFFVQTFSKIKQNSCPESIPRQAFPSRTARQHLQAPIPKNTNGHHQPSPSLPTILIIPLPTPHPTQWPTRHEIPAQAI